MKERSKNSFHFNTIRTAKFKNKYFNNINKSSKKPIFQIKDKRISVYEKKKKLDLSSLSKSSINNSNNREFEYLHFYKLYANKILKNKYNCSKIIKSQIYRKYEIISIYNINQINYLIKKKKSRIYCRLKEISIFYKKEEYLINVFKQRESKIILKYLLFFVYDKDKMTFDERITQKTKKDKIESNYEKIIPSINKRYMLMQNNKDSFIGDNNKNKQKLYKKYKFVTDLSPYDIRNSIPNLYPININILKDIKEYLRKKLYQKLFKKKYYYKNIYGNYDTNKFNKSSKEDKTSKSRTIVNKSFSKYFFKKKNNIFSNHNNDKRIKNDADIYDVEKLIKSIKGKDNKYKKKSLLNKKVIFDEMTSSQPKKKLIFNYINNNNRDKSTEKNRLSQDSTTLTLRKRGNNKSVNLKTKSLFRRDKSSKNKYPKKEVNIFYKKLFRNSSKNYLGNSISLKNEVNKKNVRYTVDNIHLRKILVNNNKSNNESILSESFKKFVNNEKDLKCKYMKLKDFLKYDDETKYSFTKKSVKIFKPTKSFEYHNELYIFAKNNNENIWENGEDLSAQIKAKEIKEAVMYKLNKMNNKNVNRLKKSYSLKKMIYCGDIYNDISV